MYTDKTLTCRDCGASFVFTTGEQEFFANGPKTQQPMPNSPCTPCAPFCLSCRFMESQMWVATY